MSAVPHFTEERIAELCDLATVTDWLERAWRDLGAGEAATTLRVRAAASGLMGSAMAASWPRHRVVGGKLYLTHPDGFAFLVGLFSPDVGLVATVTSSYTPVFDGTRLHDAALVCAVGSTKADRREVDGATVQRAAFVVSDSAEGARTEAGDLIHAAADGMFDWDDLADLADVVAGTVTPPQPGNGIMLFESQGVALQDVVIATLAHQRSEQR